MINMFTLKIFKIIFMNFQVDNKEGRSKYISETFWMTNIKIEVSLKILFLKVSNTDSLFVMKTLQQKSYMTNKA